MTVRPRCGRCGLKRISFCRAGFQTRIWVREFATEKLVLCPYCIWDIFGEHPDCQS